MGIPKRQSKPKEGDVIAIPLGDGRFGYGQVCSSNCYAYFDYQSRAIESSELVVNQLILFRVITARDSIKTGGWVIIGNEDLKGILKRKALFWVQSIGSNEINIYEDGVFTPSSPAEVQGMEAMACWHSQHVVERLVDHFSGRANGIANRVNRVRTYDLQTGNEIDPPTL